MSFDAYLAEEMKLHAQKITPVACEEFGISLFDTRTLDIDSASKAEVDEKLTRAHQAIPLLKQRDSNNIAMQGTAMSLPLWTPSPHGAMRIKNYGLN